MTSSRAVDVFAARQKLFVYERSLAAVETRERIATSVQVSRPDLADRLRRASTSIALNIAEGAAEFSAKEKIRSYRMARRSAAESDAILDVLPRVGCPSALGAQARREIDEVLAPLARTMNGVERKM
jgi:four helix bundle protein